MASSSSTFSTTVRTVLKLTALRLQFALGSRFWPEATVARASRLFSTPTSAARSRPTPDGATELTESIDGLPVTIYRWGDPAQQPYVLFAHGWSSSGTRIRTWLPALRKAGYAVVAFDQSGHGRSGGRQAHLPGFTALLLEMGRRFGPAKAVVGHSLGGAAAAIALARGLQAERAILLAPAADPIDAAYRFARFVWLGPWLGERMIRRFEARLGQRFDDQQAHRVAHVLAQPALIVHDLEDHDVAWAEGERYARYWHGSRLLSTRGLGHRRIVDDPQVIDAGLRFLAGQAVGERVVSSPNLPFGLA